MSPRENWVRMPKESAAAWSTFGFYEQAVGRMLLIHLDGYAGPVPGQLEASVARMLCGSVGDGNERRRIRAAVKRLQEAGLVFEHEGQIYVLYDHRQWTKYRELGARIAKERAEAKLPPAGAVPEAVTKRQRRPANDNAKSCSRRVLTVSSPCTHFELTSENHSKPRVREREILKQSAMRSEREQPSAAPLSPVIPLQKAQKKPRAESALSRNREALKALFGECYERKYPGRTSLPKRQDLFTIAAQSFRLPDGTLDESRARAAITAYLNDGWWTAQPSRPGHSFDAWAKHYERYETLADRDRAAEQQGRIAIHGF